MKNKKTGNKLKIEWPKILLKLSLTTLILAIFLTIFFANDGVNIFKDTLYVSDFYGNDFQLHCIDVGQGDSFLIRLPNDKTMLIDCGEQDSGNKVKSYINQYFAKEKLSKIDYFVLTHPDSDHIGGGDVIVDNFEIENLFRPKYYSLYEEENLSNLKSYKVSDSQTYDYIISKAYQKNISIYFSEKGLTIDENGFKIEFLSPKKDVYSNSNDYSAVIMITCHGKRALFMGDASTNIETTLLSDYGNDLKADILKIGHHGSKTSTSQEFLQAVNPSHAIISVDKNNSYSLPDVNVLKNLYSSNVIISSTAELGNFAMTIENDEVVIAKQGQLPIDIALLISATILSILILWAIPMNFKWLEINKSNKKQK